jgi:DNA/RNA-binding domain of Phe-tRNA-synthetase-like protein
LHHYYTVFKGGAKPEPGLKPYSRFYQYTYVAIYRQLQAELQAAKEKAALSDAYLQHLADEVSFEPVMLSSETRIHAHAQRYYKLEIKPCKAPPP